MNNLAKTTLSVLAASFILASCGGKIARHSGVDTPDAEKKLDHLIISEIFYIGSWREAYTCTYEDRGSKKTIEVSAGMYPINDAYIKIYNPTEETKFLDGLGLVLSKIDPADPFTFKDPKEDFTKDFIGVDRISMFPGSGHDHPIKPGQTILIVASAGNHHAEVLEDEELDQRRPGNPLSFDFSNADWEWLPERDADEDPLSYLPDNPKVKNMVDVYHEEWDMHDVEPFSIDRNTDRRGIALVDLHTETPNNPEAVKKALANEDDKTKPYFWKKYTATIVSTNSYTVVDHCIGLPKQWCIDAVTIAPKSQFKWLPFPKDIDKGAFGVNVAHSTKYSKETLGHSMKRKHDGLKFVDNDNSAMDFETVPASIDDVTKKASEKGK